MQPSLLVGIETNFSTYPIRELERLGYTNQYVRETEDEFTHRTLHSFGFKTTSLTRPVIIAQLVQILRENVSILNDRKTLEELLTFVRNSHGRPEARQGAHDDLVMSLAITFYIRSQQEYAKTLPKTEFRKWESDMIEDYLKADLKTRQEMEKLWGS